MSMTTYVEVAQAELDVLVSLGHEMAVLTSLFSREPREEYLLKIAEMAADIKRDADVIARRTNVSRISDNRA